jgi:hypothetical protein
MKFTLKRASVLLLICGFSFLSSQAQVKFGIKAGANFSTFSGSDAGGASSLIGFNGGVLVKIHLIGGWGIQPEALYSGQGAKYSSPGNGTGTFNNAYINIPVLLTYKLPFGLSFQVGPQFGILMSAKASSGGVSVDEKSNYKSSDVSLDMGAAFMTPFKLGFDARYNLGLANIENTNVAGNTGQLKNGVFQLGVFYILGGL